MNQKIQYTLFLLAMLAILLMAMAASRQFFIWWDARSAQIIQPQEYTPQYPEIIMEGVECRYVLAEPGGLIWKEEK